MEKKVSFFNTEMPDQFPSLCPKCGERLNRRYAFYKKPTKITALVERWKYGLTGMLVVTLVICLFLFSGICYYTIYSCWDTISCSS